MGYWRAVSATNSQLWNCCHKIPPPEPDGSQGQWVHVGPTYCTAATPPLDNGTYEGQLAFVSPCIDPNQVDWTFNPSGWIGGGPFGGGYPVHWAWSSSYSFCDEAPPIDPNQLPDDPLHPTTVSGPCISNNQTVFMWTRDGVQTTTQCLTNEENALNWTFSLRQATLLNDIGTEEYPVCYLDKQVFTLCQNGGYRQLTIGGEAVELRYVGHDYDGDYIEVWRPNPVAHKAGELVIEAKWIVDAQKKNWRIPTCCYNIIHSGYPDCDNGVLLSPNFSGSFDGQTTTTICDPTNTINWVWIENPDSNLTANDPCPDRCGCGIYIETWSCTDDISPAWDITEGGITLEPNGAYFGGTSDSGLWNVHGYTTYQYKDGWWELNYHQYLQCVEKLTGYLVPPNYTGTCLQTPPNYQGTTDGEQGYTLALPTTYQGNLNQIEWQWIDDKWVLIGNLYCAACCPKPTPPETPDPPPAYVYSYCLTEEQNKIWWTWHDPGWYVADDSDATGTRQNNAHLLGCQPNIPLDPETGQILVPDYVGQYQSSPCIPSEHINQIMWRWNSWKNDNDWELLGNSCLAGVNSWVASFGSQIYYPNDPFSCPAQKPDYWPPSQEGYNADDYDGHIEYIDCVNTNNAVLSPNTTALLNYGLEKYNDIAFIFNATNLVEGDELKILWDGGNGCCTITIGSGESSGQWGDWSGDGTITMEWGGQSQTRTCSGTGPTPTDPQSNPWRWGMLWIHSSLDGSEQVASINWGDTLSITGTVSDPRVGIGCGESDNITLGVLQVSQATRFYNVTALNTNDNPYYYEDPCVAQLPTSSIYGGSTACPVGSDDCSGWCIDGILPKTITINVSGWIGCGIVPCCKDSGEGALIPNQINICASYDGEIQGGTKVDGSACDPCEYPNCINENFHGCDSTTLTKPWDDANSLNGEYTLERDPGGSCEYLYYSEGEDSFGIALQLSNVYGALGSGGDNLAVSCGWGNTSTHTCQLNDNNCINAGYNFWFEPIWANFNALPKDCMSDLEGITMTGYTSLFYYYGCMEDGTVDPRNKSACFGNSLTETPGSVTITAVSYD